MGSRQDAVLVMKNEVFEELQSLNTEWSDELFRMAKNTVHGDEQVLLEFGYIKVYYGTEGNEFNSFIKQFDKEDYYLYVLLTEGIADYGVDYESVGELEPEWEIDFETDVVITY